MLLSPEQVKWVNEEKKTVERVIASKPENWMYWQDRLNMLRLLIQIHNVGIEEKKNEKG